MRKIRIAASATIACLVLAGCGAGDVTRTPDEPEGPSVTSPAQPNPSDPADSTDPTPSVGPDPGSPRPGDPATQPPVPPKRSMTPGGPGVSRPGGPMTITGTVTAGVESGCLLLDDYLLVGGDKDLVKVGARVTVTGEVRSDLMTTCQQGTPFLVRSAKRV